MPPKIKDNTKFSWTKVGLNKEDTNKLKAYLRRNPNYTDAHTSTAMAELVVEALNSDVIQRNIDLVKLLEDMDNLNIRDKEGMTRWQNEKARLLGYDTN